MEDRYHGEVTGIAGVVLRVIGAVLSLPFKVHKKNKKK